MTRVLRHSGRQARIVLKGTKLWIDSVFYGRRPSNSNKYLASCVLVYILFKSSQETEGNWLQPYFLNYHLCRGTC